MMKIFKIWQEENIDYDTFDSMIVCAENEQEAKSITPGDRNFKCYDWCSSIEFVYCEEIGTAKEGQVKGIILASFNAG